MDSRVRNAHPTGQKKRTDHTICPFLEAESNRETTYPLRTALGVLCCRFTLSLSSFPGLK